jgi:hypothetical protein
MEPPAPEDYALPAIMDDTAPIDMSFMMDMNIETPYRFEGGTLPDTDYLVNPPGYMRQTFSGAQPSNANGQAEGERIRNSFRSGSLWSLKKLPAKFENGAVTNKRIEHTKKNLTSKPQKVYSSELGPLSKRAEKYENTSYDKVNMLSKLNVDETKFRNEAFSRKPFTTPAGVNKHPASGFIDPDFGPGAAIPDDFIARKPKEETFIAGPFYKCVPAQAREVPRTKAKFFVENLYKQLRVDWAHLMFSVKLTKNEIVIKFPTTSQELPPENALYKYMLRQAAHGDPQSWGLRKRGDRWGTVEVPTPSDASSSISSVLHEQTQAMEPMTTFSYYLPWVVSGLHAVTKKAAHSQRQLIRDERQKKIDEEKRFETAFQDEQSSNSSSKQSKKSIVRTRTKLDTDIDLVELMKRRASKGKDGANLMEDNKMAVQNLQKMRIRAHTMV